MKPDQIHFQELTFIQEGEQVLRTLETSDALPSALFDEVFAASDRSAMVLYQSGPKFAILGIAFFKGT